MTPSQVAAIENKLRISMLADWEKAKARFQSINSDAPLSEREPRQAQIAKAKERRALIARFIAENPGHNEEQMTGKIGLEYQTIRGHLIWLRKNRAIHNIRGKGYFPGPERRAAQ